MKKEPCKYCDEEPKPLIEKGLLKLVLDEDGDIVARIDLGSWAPFAYKSINYCPMCGRKLEDA